MHRMHALMVSAGIAGLLTSFAPQALAQQFGGTYSTNQGGNYYGGGLPQQNDVDNIGAEDGQFVFGFERVTSLAFDRQTVSFDDQDTGNEVEHTYKSTSLNLLGVDASSPSQMPRFALDYVIASGFTAGVSLAFTTRSLSLDGGSYKQPVLAPSTVRSEGVTFFGGARVGYAYAVDETFGIWPRAGISYASSTGEYEAVVDPNTGATQTFDTSARFFDLDLEVLGVISPVEHTAILIGPYLDLGLSGKYDVDVPVDTDNPDGVDSRNIKLTSFGLVVHAVGYY
ncbi:MAG TPA: hypothetical protein VM686_06565 [Polyangiaceae bacterium]|nr:hypothetical protein [Polyangiaceae bacterium]